MPIDRQTLTSSPFERIEGRFAWQARAWTLLVGATGFYLSWMLDLWDRFRSPHY